MKRFVAFMNERNICNRYTFCLESSKSVSGKCFLSLSGNEAAEQGGDLSGAEEERESLEPSSS